MTMNRREFMAAGALGMASGLVRLASGRELDAGLLPYKTAPGVSGSISSIGSDTLANLMTYWAEAFQKNYPNVSVQIESKGSGTAFPALIAGTSQFGPMSRAAKPTEEDQFESRYGYKATQVRVAVDAVGIFVNKDNPLQSISLDQLDAIYSKARRRGVRKASTTWGDVGLTGEWGNKSISLFGRNSASGTYGFFKENVMKTGDFRDEVKEQPGTASVILGVAEDRTAIGYGGIGYSTSSVRAISLSEHDGEASKTPTAANAYSGDYPLSRYLYIYINRAPGKPLTPIVQEFIRMVCSKEGQQLVAKDGFFPLKSATAAEELRKVD
ncbi:MAG TPA: phosphate ABC transporter substrate-binding protein [Planctomycetota bacterium]|nr:phosphate ABC transporter substrate-binding protein [Planctomycetota bacterium]